MTIKTRALAQISNRRTSYEVELVINGTVTHLGFTERKTRSVLISFSQKAADAILPHVPEGHEWKYSHGQITWAPGVVVRFSGRTEYQICVNQGG